MKQQKFYIALGSNSGDKFKNLQAAIDAIYLQIGTIKLISKVYKAPAFGFEEATEDFYNACLILESELKPSVVLKKLLAIETSLGRTRTKAQGYQSRTIDLDILLIVSEDGDVVIDSKSLQVPHPEMHKRRFVLEPLQAMIKVF